MSARLTVAVENPFRPKGVYDAVVVIGPSTDIALPAAVQAAVKQAAAVDRRFGHGASLLVTPDVAGGRLIFSGTGMLDGDTDDVRRELVIASLLVGHLVVLFDEKGEYEYHTQWPNVDAMRHMRVCALARRTWIDPKTRRPQMALLPTRLADPLADRFERLACLLCTPTV